MKKEFALALKSDDVQLVSNENHVNITMWIDRWQLNGIVDSNLFAIIEHLRERGLTVELPKKADQ